MEYGIQHRSIYLTPLGSEIDWLADQLDREDIWRMFGYEGPSGAVIRAGHASGEIVLGVIRRVRDRKRIGFVMCAPLPLFGTWELMIGIPDPADRDFFSAIHSMDALGHYIVEHLGITSAMARIKENNRASLAVAQRLGYDRFFRNEIRGETYRFYTLSAAAWFERRKKLDQAEAASPSGLGATFAMLDGPAFEPKEPIAGPLPGASPSASRASDEEEPG
jgi:RimJ/RimL family protein N-acetyltransferase